MAQKGIDSTDFQRITPGRILLSFPLVYTSNAHLRLQNLVVREAFRPDTNRPTGIANGPAAFESASAPG